MSCKDAVKQWFWSPTESVTDTAWKTIYNKNEYAVNTVLADKTMLKKILVHEANQTIVTFFLLLVRGKLVSGGLRTYWS